MESHPALAFNSMRALFYGIKCIDILYTLLQCIEEKKWFIAYIYYLLSRYEELDAFHDKSSSLNAIYPLSAQ